MTSEPRPVVSAFVVPIFRKPRKMGQPQSRSRKGGQPPNETYCKLFVPVPDRPTVCGLPPPSSATPRVAVAKPVCVGENVTLKVQLPPAGTLDPQLFVSAKTA